MVYVGSPSSPKEMGWASHFPKFFATATGSNKQVEVADIGCGFGGLIVSLATKLPNTLMLGMLRLHFVFPSRLAAASCYSQKESYALLAQRKVVNSQG